MAAAADGRGHGVLRLERDHSAPSTAQGRSCEKTCHVLLTPGERSSTYCQQGGKAERNARASPLQLRADCSYVL